MKIKILFLIAVALFSSIATAGTTCTGKIERLGISSTSGDVHLQIQPSTGIFQLCNIEVKTGRITPSVCKIMYSTLLAARLSGKDVSLHFPSLACSELGGWNYPDQEPYFFEIEKYL